MTKKRRQHGTGCLFLARRKWWLRYYVRGQRVTENSKLEDRNAAEVLLRQRVAEAAAGEIEVLPGKATIANLCELVLADYDRRELRDRKTVAWRYHANLKPLLGRIVAGRLTKRHIGDYIERRRAAGASNATINRELSILRRGHTLGMREEPPLVRKAPYIPMLEEDNVRQGFLENEQYEILLEEMPVRLKAFFVCAYHVGTRKGELRRIRWDQVDFEASVIRLGKAQTKGKKPRTLPIYGAMERWLGQQLATAPAENPFVFHGARGCPIGDHLDGWQEACERAGFPELLAHDLRRSAIRNMKRAGIQDTVAMAISGHRTRAVFDRYNIVDEQDLELAGERLENYFQKRKRDRAARLERVK